MRKFVIFVGVLGAVALPAAAQAGTTTSPADRQNAAQECRFERGTTAATREAFTLKYGTNDSKANAFGKCVSKTAREERTQRATAKTGAPQACKTEQGTTTESKAAFALKYGTNGKGKNAFGKCVSAKARELKQQADDQDRKDAIARKSAAKQCDEERGTTPATRDAFARKYGSGAKHRNALGKCVSKLAKTLRDDDGQHA
jgi:Tfp pilus assembly protein PilV